MQNKKALLNKIFNDEQLNLIYDALNDYDIQAQCIDEENGNTDVSDLLDSVMNVIIDCE